MKRIVTMICILLVGAGALHAQTDRREVRRGNRDFAKAKYSEAEVDYKKALIRDSLSNAAGFNLANTYYKMEDYAQAEKYMAGVVDSLDRQGRGADAFYNLGSSCLRQRNWQGAVDAFKNSLRRNPGDMDAKSNLAYAQKMLENEQQQQDQNQDGNNGQNQDQNQQNDQNNDQNQNNDDQDKDQNNGDDQNDRDQNQDQNQNSQNDQQDQNRNKDQNQQGQQPKISQQAAQQMLQAIQAQEDKTQEKVKKEKALQARSKQKEKNW